MKASRMRTAVPTSMMWSGWWSPSRGSSAGMTPASDSALQPDDEADSAPTSDSSASTKARLNGRAPSGISAAAPLGAAPPAAAAGPQRGDRAVHQHRQQPRLAARADRGDDGGVPAAIEQLHGEHAQRRRAQVLGHRVARGQQADEVADELGLGRVELGERLGAGVALEEHVEGEQAHARQVAPPLQAPEPARHAHRRQQLEPAQAMRGGRPRALRHMAQEACSMIM